MLEGAGSVNIKLQNVRSQVRSGTGLQKKNWKEKERRPHGQIKGCRRCEISTGARLGRKRRLDSNNNNFDLCYC